MNPVEHLTNAEFFRLVHENSQKRRDRLAAEEPDVEDSRFGLWINMLNTEFYACQAAELLEEDQTPSHTPK